MKAIKKDEWIDRITDVACDCASDGYNYNMAETMATKVVEDLVNTLNIDSVSQQRELFYNFITWYNAKPNKNKEKMIYTDTIEEYLKL